MRVSTAEFIGGFDGFADRAETEPVTITEGGHDRLVLVSAGEYARRVERDLSASATGKPAWGEGGDLGSAAEHNILGQGQRHHRADRILSLTVVTRDGELLPYAAAGHLAAVLRLDRRDAP